MESFLFKGQTIQENESRILDAIIPEKLLSKIDPEYSKLYIENYTKPTNGGIPMEDLSSIKDKISILNKAKERNIGRVMDIAALVPSTLSPTRDKNEKGISTEFVDSYEVLDNRFSIRIVGYDSSDESDILLLASQARNKEDFEKFLKEYTLTWNKYYIEFANTQSKESFLNDYRLNNDDFGFSDMDIQTLGNNINMNGKEYTVVNVTSKFIRTKPTFKYN